MTQARSDSHTASVRGVDCDGEGWELTADLSAGPVLLVFYRGSWCFLSRRALAALREELPLFTRQGCQVVLVSVEPTEKMIELRRRLKLSFRIVADDDLAIAGAFALPIERRFGCPFPAALLIAPGGQVLFRHVGRTGRDWPDWRQVAAKIPSEPRTPTGAA
ncbi:MAG: redoxin domain-containing protein [Candidatus Wallbacteria bacterium]|nr:redoxin domain-containing protein [Candidatus Wallbacteria bacterium]